MPARLACPRSVCKSICIIQSLANSIPFVEKCSSSILFIDECSVTLRWNFQTSRDGTAGGIRFAVAGGRLRIAALLSSHFLRDQVATDIRQPLTITGFRLQLRIAA